MRIKISAEQSANVEIVPTSDGGVEIIVHYGDIQKNYGSNENKPSKFKFHGKGKQTVEELIDNLRQFCSDRIKEEPEWKEDIIKFGKFYSERVKAGWNGELRISDLYNNWCNKRK